jgi:hypothetical protein
MIIKGTCQKQLLMTAIHDAILSPGSRWSEISSNKTNDFLNTGGTDGWVFKSPPIGSKQQSIFLTLKSLDLSLSPLSTPANKGANHLLMWLSENYVPGSSGVNGVHTNKSAAVIYWAFCQVDTVNCAPTSLFDYIIDIKDHRIIIIIQRNNLTTTTYPGFIYMGYPELVTNLEGSNYINQFIIGTNVCNLNSNSANTTGRGHWYKGSSGNYNALAISNCVLNNSNPNPMGLYLLNPISITGDGGTGLADTGPLGILDGLYGLPSVSIVNKDIVNIGLDEYLILDLSQFINNKQINLGGFISTYFYYHNITPTIIAIKTN